MRDSHKINPLYVKGIQTKYNYSYYELIKVIRHYTYTKMFGILTLDND